MRNKILFLTLAFTCFSPEVFAGCQCLCGQFKTRGGERKICAVAPAPLKGGICRNYYQYVPNADSQGACQNLGENENPCQGFAQHGDMWMEVFDGRYHSCRFNY